MKYYIIAGEASGDLHASNLMKGILKYDHHAQFRFWGGDQMAEVSGELRKHYKDLAFMGISEVLKNLITIKKNFTFCKKDIIEFQPDTVIFVDYPGFNLRMAKFVKSKKLKTYYYISPTVWAWHKSRIKTIKNYIDKLYVILPFEKKFFAKNNLLVEYFGHPLVDSIDKSVFSNKTEFFQKNNLEDKPIIALLAGSRKQELEKILPIMLSVTEYFPDYQFVIAGVDTQKDTYKNLIQNSIVKIIFNQTYELVYHAESALVTSGTATLETAIIGTPQVVCYKTSALTYRIAKLLVKIKFISLVNLIMDKEVVKELIQSDFNKENLKLELIKILPRSENRSKIIENYKLLQTGLGEKPVSEKIAKNMVEQIKNN